MTIKTLVRRANELYPTSKKMRHSWVRQTYNLYQTKRHALLTGGWKEGQY